MTSYDPDSPDAGEYNDRYGRYGRYEGNTEEDDEYEYYDQYIPEEELVGQQGLQDWEDTNEELYNEGRFDEAEEKCAELPLIVQPKLVATAKEVRDKWLRRLEIVRNLFLRARALKNEQDFQKDLSEILKVLAVLVIPDQSWREDLKTSLEDYRKSMNSVRDDVSAQEVKNQEWWIKHSRTRGKAKKASGSSKMTFQDNDLSRISKVDFKYTIGACIDGGSTGKVYEAEEKTGLHRAYARKMILCSNEAMKNRAKNEIKILRLAQQYKIGHVVRLVQGYELGGYYNLILNPRASCNLSEFLSGIPREREDYADDSGSGISDIRVSRPLVFSWIRCLSGTLAHLHDCNIRHRDINPNNILVDGYRIMFADFEHSLSENAPRDSHLVFSTNTGVYAPPEIYKTKSRRGPPGMRNRISPRQEDVWSFGCVIYEMLDAISTRAVVKHMFPVRQLSQSTFEALIWDQEFMDKIENYDDTETKNIKERASFPGLTRSLLKIVFTMMLVDSDQRYSSREVFESISDAMEYWWNSRIRCSNHQ